MLKLEINGELSSVERKMYFVFGQKKNFCIEEIALIKKIKIVHQNFQTMYFILSSIRKKNVPFRRRLNINDLTESCFNKFENKINIHLNIS